MPAIKINFEFDNPSEAAAFLVSVSNIGVQQAAANEAAPAKKEAAAAAPKPKAEKATPVSAPAAPAPSPDTAKAVQDDAVVKSTPTPEPQPDTEQVADATSAIDYPTLQKAVFALAGKSREAAAAVAASFEVKTFKDLPEAKWAEALAAVNAKIAEL